MLLSEELEKFCLCRKKHKRKHEKRHNDFMKEDEENSSTEMMKVFKWFRSADIDEIISVKNFISIKNNKKNNCIESFYKGDMVNVLIERNSVNCLNEKLYLMRTALVDTPQINENNFNTNLRNLTNNNREIFWNLKLKDERYRTLYDERLRWATLGYHYDWTNRKYEEDHKSEYPKDLKELMEEKWNGIDKGTQFPKYSIETTIVNYYKLNDNLCLHKDDIEKADNAPLLSMSFGLPAIFLIGSQNVNGMIEKIVLVEEGDLIILINDGRQYYHGVPRILSANEYERITGNKYQSIEKRICNNCKYCRKQSEIVHENIDKEIFKYLEDHRINFSFRQVNKNS
ncbi:hypothetical protein SNEBB_005201 [Seison nebaliae]|nr:hypothetical protein SNEBB_005201 [Seison nebaliae]